MLTIINVLQIGINNDVFLSNAINIFNATINLIFVFIYRTRMLNAIIVLQYLNIMSCT